MLTLAWNKTNYIYNLSKITDLLLSFNEDIDDFDE